LEADALVTSIEDVIRIITPIVEPSSVKRVILFGSFAKGTHTINSDIDLVIDSGGQLRGMDFFILSSAMEKALPIEADIFEQREIKLNSNMFNTIAREGVIIYER
jgi:predicted nucleotidyltransferase